MFCLAGIIGVVVKLNDNWCCMRLNDIFFV